MRNIFFFFFLTHVIFQGKKQKNRFQHMEIYVIFLKKSSPIDIEFFTTFFTIVELVNCFWFSYEFTINTTLLSTINNISPR